MTRKPTLLDPENLPTVEDWQMICKSIAEDVRRQHAAFTPEQLAHIEDQARICREMTVTHEILLRFSRGEITKEQAIDEAGLRDYAELLVTMGDFEVPIPSLPQEDIDAQLKDFIDLWNDDRV